MVQHYIPVLRDSSGKKGLLTEYKDTAEMKVQISEVLGSLDVVSGMIWQGDTA